MQRKNPKKDPAARRRNRAFALNTMVAGPSNQVYNRRRVRLALKQEGVSEEKIEGIFARAEGRAAGDGQKAANAAANADTPGKAG